MPYAALPAARRMHYNIDGSQVFWSQTGFGVAVNQWSQATLNHANGEYPNDAVEVTTIQAGSVSDYVWVFFPELIDLSFLETQYDGGNMSFGNLASSTNSTNGADGTWTAMAGSGAALQQHYAGDFWRSDTPASITTNNTAIKAIRFTATRAGTSTAMVHLYLWGNKHAGQTPDDIIFLESDGTTEWPNDDDWGDVQAGTGFVTHTYYVKNTSSLTAHTITVKSSGSDTGQWTVSLDNASFGSSQSISSLAPGASQIIYVKFTIPAGSASAYRPYAAYIEADVASWS